MRRSVVDIAPPARRRERVANGSTSCGSLGFMLWVAAIANGNVGIVVDAVDYAQT